jgi:hypothetical protein
MADQKNKSASGTTQKGGAQGNRNVSQGNQKGDQKGDQKRGQQGGKSGDSMNKGPVQKGEPQGGRTGKQDDRSRERAEEM